jgi:hypothetical protein
VRRGGLSRRPNRTNRPVSPMRAGGARAGPVECHIFLLDTHQ